MNDCERHGHHDIVDRISTYEDFLANETVKLQVKEKYKL